MKKALIALIIATMTLALAGCSKNKKEEIVPEAPASSAEEEKNDENTPKEDIKTDTGKETAETAEPANDPQLAEALKYAEPLYWVKAGMQGHARETDDGYFYGNYILEITWIETDKETDILYVIAQTSDQGN